MSRKQWGHGYWKGVRDAEINHVKTYPISIKEMAKFFIYSMCRSNYQKKRNASLAPTSEIISRLQFAGHEKEDAVKLAKDIYDYIFWNNPLNCYVTGAKTQKWYEDFYVLPIGQLSKEDCERGIEAFRRGHNDGHQDYRTRW